MKLSILDQMMIPNGITTQEAFENSIKLAEMADKAGYHRMWYSEHHGMQQIMNSAPELFIANMAARTSNIRLGSGGVMMPNHRPYKLAEMFKTLSLLAPGRIDFGVGRAPGGTMAASRALNSSRSMSTDFYDEIAETLHYLTKNNEVPNSLFAAPVDVSLPEAWLLGSSGQSAYKAAELGMGYSHAQFIGGAPELAALDIYRATFQPSAFHATPQINASFFVVIGETEAEANYHASSVELSSLLLQTPHSGIYPPDVAQSYPYTPSDLEQMKLSRESQRLIVGTAEQVAKQLQAYEQRYGIDEFILACNIYDQSVKLKGFSDLAKIVLQ